MAAILKPKFKVSSVTKISTPEFDKKNGGYAEFEIVAEVRFSLYSDDGDIEELTADATHKLESALS